MPVLECKHFVKEFIQLQHVTYPLQSFRLRPEARRIIRSFLIPRPLLLSIFVQYLLFKESELQPCLRNAGNGISECSILKISWGECPQTPLGACVFGACKAPCGAKTNFMSSAFTTMSTTYKAIENPACETESPFSFCSVKEGITACYCLIINKQG